MDLNRFARSIWPIPLLPILAALVAFALAAAFVKAVM